MKLNESKREDVCKRKFLMQFKEFFVKIAILQQKKLFVKLFLKRWRAFQLEDF